MNNIIFHLGYPKTGSTTLQNRLLGQHPDILYIRAKVGLDRFGTNMREHSIEDVLLDYLETARTVRDDERTRVVSNESLIFVHEQPIRVLERIRETEPHAKVMFVIRNQSDLIRSWYDMTAIEDWTGSPEWGGHRAVWPRTVSLDEYIDRLLDKRGFLDRLKYNEVLEQAKGIIADEDLFVFSFKSLFVDQTETHRLAQLLRISADDIRRSLSQAPLNDYLNYKARANFRRLLGPIRGSWFLPLPALRSINRRVGRIMRLQRSVLSDSQRSRIEEYFRSDNDLLKRRHPEVGAL